jgi:hypothetical protein
LSAHSGDYQADQIVGAILEEFRMDYTISIATTEPLVPNESLDETMKKRLGSAEGLGLERCQGASRKTTA